MGPGLAIQQLGNLEYVASSLTAFFCLLGIPVSQDWCGLSKIAGPEVSVHCPLVTFY